MSSQPPDPAAIEQMTKALALYEKAGFVPIEPYYDTPLADTIFLGRRLAAG